ncbi:hypothetical protein FHS15_005335 [Paenibacillus castaneae]|uniref:hypothetical protein n=1 Tax=Paenibacillus castaneae TaxID=474957 RepID=UPI0011AED253|nr:hypothetical protein [Paenibacillus castaneae]NIK80151.1 hypothetical protein [Paenibacillus castaneae]
MTYNVYVLGKIIGYETIAPRCDWLTAGTCSFFELFDKGFSLFDYMGGWSVYGDAVVSML